MINRTKLAQSIFPLSRSFSFTLSVTPVPLVHPPPPSVLALLRGYGGHLVMPVMFAQQDSFKHINNAVYAQFAEAARLEAFQAMARLYIAERCDAADPAAVDEVTRLLEEYMTMVGVGPILRDLHLRYKFPVTYPDQLSLASCISHLSHDRYAMRHLIVSHRHERVACEAEGTICSYDYRMLSKADHMPPVIMEMVNLFQQRYPGQPKQIHGHGQHAGKS